MKCLVSGSHGFIGEHLVARLEREHSVRRLSREELANSRQVLTEYQPEWIFHLAAYGSHRTEKGPRDIFNVNVVGTFNLLMNSLDIPYKALILVGSSVEYGKVRGPMREDLKLKPETHYAASKAACTMLGRSFAAEHGLPILTVRPFSVYGPNEGDHRFIPTVIRSCLTQEPMKLAPKVNHDWIYVDDFVSGLHLSAEIAHFLQGKELHFGTGLQLSNGQIVELIEELTGKKANINEDLPPHASDSRDWLADNSLARSWGWTPDTSIVRGLQKTIEFYKDKYAH